MPNRQTECVEVVRFGEFELIPASGELRRDGSRIPLQDQPIRVLIALLAEAGSLVTRERLREELWPGGVYVDFEHGLNTAVRRLREALGDNADTPRFIETLPRRGYRFIAPVSATTAPRQKPPPRRWRSPGAAAVVALCGLAVAAVALWRRSPAAPHVTSVRQVTHDGTTKVRVYTDGMRVYYSAFSGASVKLLQAPVTGGDSAPLETSLRRPFIHDILPARNELLVEDDAGWAAPYPLWLLPTAGGSARPLGDIEADDAAWSADGQQVVYTKGRDIYAARGDGSGSRRLLSAPATSVRHPRLSPDGQRLRYTLVDMTTLSLWEAAGDGSGAHALLPGWNAGYGRWTPDGRYYVFAADRDGASALWARQERGRWPWSGTPSREPSKLNAGPMRYFAPACSPDGRTIFALGRPPSGGGELVRYDSASGLFVPFLGGLSAREVEFSRDGRWVAYVRQPDGTLWRSRPDGTEPRQLTFPPLTAVLPRWSPDGRSIAYMSFLPGEKWESHVLAAEGGKPRPVTGRPGDLDPSWSPDGARLVLGRSDTDTDHMPRYLILVDLRAGKESAIPGSEGLFSPRWSPDGRSIVAVSADVKRLALFEFATGRWRDLVVAGGLLGYPSWTRDSSRIQLLNGDSIARVRATDGHVEPVASLGRVGPVVTPGSWSWVGIAPDDSPLMCREMTGAVEVYALDVEWP
ncbi:MAG TPA: winged helix-turn-helix domain-containing protein [Anaeromyxobacteraceae bacterium]|nr:winged helix-turn-helix domain-containing protein [Anaeromyxobacteraceae bacterium]